MIQYDSDAKGNAVMKNAWILQLAEAEKLRIPTYREVEGSDLFGPTYRPSDSDIRKNDLVSYDSQPTFGEPLRSERVVTMKYEANVRGNLNASEAERYSRYT